MIKSWVASDQCIIVSGLDSPSLDPSTVLIQKHPKHISCHFHHSPWYCKLFFGRVWLVNDITQWEGAHKSFRWFLLSEPWHLWIELYEQHPNGALFQPMYVGHVIWKCNHHRIYKFLEWNLHQRWKCIPSVMTSLEMSYSRAHPSIKTISTITWLRDLKELWQPSNPLCFISKVI